LKYPINKNDFCYDLLNDKITDFLNRNIENIEEKEIYTIKSTYNKEDILSMCQYLTVNLITLSILVLNSNYHQIIYNNKTIFDIKIKGNNVIHISRETTNSNNIKQVKNYLNNLIPNNEIEDYEKNESRNKKEEIINIDINKESEDNDNNNDDIHIIQIEGDNNIEDKDLEKENKQTEIKEPIKKESEESKNRNYIINTKDNSDSYNKNKKDKSFIFSNVYIQKKKKNII